MKKPLALLIALITIIVCVPTVSVNADPSPVYTLSASVPDAAVSGQLFSARFSLTNTGCASGLSGGSVIITFDDSVIAFDSVSIVSSPENWTIENWTKDSLSGVIYIVCWDETQTSNSIAINESLIFDVSFSVPAGTEAQTTAINVLESYEIAPNDYYYTEILDGQTLDPVDGTYGVTNVTIILGEIVLKTFSEYEIYDDEIYYEYDDEYTELKTLHWENEISDDPTTLDVFLDNIENADNIAVFDRYGDELTEDDDELTTGCVAKVINPYSGEAISETPIVVLGDLNGDGLANVIDLALMRGHLNCDIDDPTSISKYYLQGAFYLAAKMTGSSELSVIDLSKLRGYIS